MKMESPWCEQNISKVSLAEILKCFEHPISEEQAWAICFQCCCEMEQLVQGLRPPFHSVLIKGPGSIFIHADGAASFKLCHKSDVGSIQQPEDKLLECLAAVIYEALDWGIDSKLERELSDPLEKLLCLMLKLDEEAVEPVVTLQDVIKACEEHLSRPSEATSHYGITCRSLFTEYMELQKLVTFIQTSKEKLRKMDLKDSVENTLQKKEKHWASCWPKIIQELRGGVKLRRATEQPQHRMPPKECIYSPYELLLDDIQHKRYTLRKVTIEPKHRRQNFDVAVLKPHLKPVLERKLKEAVLWESSCHEQLMAEIKQSKRLQSPAARESGRRPEEILMTPNIALKSPSNSFLTLQDVCTEFKIVNTRTQQLRPGDQETTLTCFASKRSSVISCNNADLAANCTCPPVSALMLGDMRPDGFLNAVQQKLPSYRRRSKSLERGLQSKDLVNPSCQLEKKKDCSFPTKWPSPTIAELIGTRYAMMVLKWTSFFRGGGSRAFPRAKICFSCHKQMFLKWPYSCYLCGSVVCCDCCTKMSMPFRMCVHLPLHFLKLLRLPREEDPGVQNQKSSELLHEIEYWEGLSVPVILEPHCLAQPLCCCTVTMANWLTVDICIQCEQYLLNMASSQQQSIPLRRNSWPLYYLE